MFWLANPRGGAAPFFTPEELADVRRFYARRPDAPPTPLRSLPALAGDLGVGRLLVKDESARFGLPAFKTVGVRYAVARLMAAAEGPLTALAAATAGNHGRAVARAAREHGLPAFIYVPHGTSSSRIAALHAEGAQVIVTAAGYDDTVRLMAEEAAAQGWTIVSDTAWCGYEQVPRRIMAGYTRILDEVADAGGFDDGDVQDMVVIVQAGVGSLAGAVAGWLVSRFGDARPSLVVVEPTGAACVQASLAAGRRTALAAAAPTSMAGLRCAEVSSIAWPVLHAAATVAMTVDDRQVDEAMRRLADPIDGDPAVESGPSGAAGLAALLAIAHDRELEPVRAHLPRRPGTVLVINTEGPLLG